MALDLAKLTAANEKLTAAAEALIAKVTEQNAKIKELTDQVAANDATASQAQVDQVADAMNAEADKATAAVQG